MNKPIIVAGIVAAVLIGGAAPAAAAPSDSVAPDQAYETLMAAAGLTEQGISHGFHISTRHRVLGRSLVSVGDWNARQGRLSVSTPGLYSFVRTRQLSFAKVNAADLGEKRALALLGKAPSAGWWTYDRARTSAEELQSQALEVGLSVEQLSESLTADSADGSRELIASARAVETPNGTVLTLFTRAARDSEAHDVLAGGTYSFTISDGRITAWTERTAFGSSQSTLTYRTPFIKLPDRTHVIAGPLFERAYESATAAGALKDLATTLARSARSSAAQSGRPVNRWDIRRHTAVLPASIIKTKIRGGLRLALRDTYQARTLTVDVVVAGGELTIRRVKSRRWVGALTAVLRRA